MPKFEISLEIQILGYTSQKIASRASALCAAIGSGIAGLLVTYPISPTIGPALRGLPPDSSRWNPIIN